MVPQRGSGFMTWKRPFIRATASKALGWTYRAASGLTVVQHGGRSIGLMQTLSLSEA